jgi:outer membrane protein OmpA-like peptidoglycan-associated protein
MKSLGKTYLFLGALILAGTFTMAQTGKGLVKRGDRQAHRFAYSNAIKHYEKFDKRSPGNMEVMQKIGDCYMMMNNPAKAESWYAFVVENGASNEYRFKYATALVQNGKIDEAGVQLAKYLETAPEDYLAQVRKSSCDHYNKFLQDSLRYRTQTVSINREGADFGAVSVGEKVYLASDRGDDNWIFTWLGHHFLDLYEANPAGLDDIGVPKRVKGLVNSKYHEAIMTFSPLADTVYFTRNNFYNGKAGRDEQGTMLLKTYFARNDGKKWSAVKEMNFNSKDYSAGHPTLLDGGSRMIIVSDMPGTQGGTDLFLVEREGGEWAAPVNLGKAINSPANEMFPWVDAAGNLFFASNGHEGMGGLDIFFCARKGDDWAAPKNLGFPINTSRDDFSLTLLENGVDGFLSSNRAGGKGDDDIYSFSATRTIMVDVVDAVTGKKIPDAVGWVKSGLPMVPYGVTEADGHMHFYADPHENLVVEFRKEGYDPVLDVISLEEGSVFDDIHKTIALKSGGEKVSECEEWVILDGKVLTNGMDLPEDTKISVKEKITGTPISQNLTFNYTLSKGKDYIIEMTSPAMDPITMEISTKTSNSFDTINVEIPLVPSAKELGKVFYIIYYNYDKYDIRIDASEELDRVIRFMQKYPHVKVELSSHTDSRGTDEYNMDLSKNRAEKAFNYMVAHGITRDRISFIWYGEQNLANQCANGSECSEALHQKNRRTEFRLIGL